MSMKDSIASSVKQPLKESQFIERLNEPMSTGLIKYFSNPGSLSTVGTKTSLFKVKKYGSMETKYTESEAILNEQAKFVSCYKSDLVFRKKVDIVIKQHQKLMKQKQQNYQIAQPGKYNSSNTWRIQKQAEENRLIQLYQKCKQWIAKANQTK